MENPERQRKLVNRNRELETEVGRLRGALAVSDTGGLIKFVEKISRTKSKFAAEARELLDKEG